MSDPLKIANEIIEMRTLIKRQAAYIKHVRQAAECLMDAISSELGCSGDMVLDEMQELQKRLDGK